MPTLRILTYGHPALRQECAPVRKIDAELRDLVEAMAEAMYQSHGVGLAAPQVGVLKRLLVADVDWVRRDENGRKAAETGPRNLHVYINPEIVWESDEDVRMTEGCLSLPGLEGEIYRPASVRVSYEDLAGLRYEDKLDDLLARCVQHEMDHLGGILFVDRMPFLKRAQLAGALNRLKKESLASAAP